MLGDWRHAAEELVVVSDFFDALRADAPAAQNIREKRADVVEPLRSTERDDENGIEGRQPPQHIRQVTRPTGGLLLWR